MKKTIKSMLTSRTVFLIKNVFKVDLNKLTAAVVDALTNGKNGFDLKNGQKNQ